MSSLPCRCRTALSGVHLDRSACLVHPSGNRRLARTLVVTARRLHPCWHEHRTTGPCSGCPCPGCVEFRAAARHVLDVAGVLDGGRLLPDDERRNIVLEQPLGNMAARPRPVAEPRPPAEALPPGLRDRPDPAVTKRRATRRTTPPAAVSAAPAPGPAITAPGRPGRPPTGSPPALGSTRRDGSPRAPIPHGRRSGYHRHVREGAPFPEDSGGAPCGCRRAQADYMAARNRASREERAALTRRGA